jgi:hypothetical protein
MICRHTACDAEATPGYVFCEWHREEVQLLAAMVERPTCQRCGNQMTEGVFKHDCANPAPQVPDAER